MRRIVLASLGLVISLLSTAILRAQDIEPKYKTPDTNSAVIQGRVTLPSEFQAERYFRITLRNNQSTISTIFTNKHGEFQFRNLSEGTYVVQVDAPDESFESISRQVALGRGLMIDLNLQLREKNIPETLRNYAHVVSAAELRQVIPPAAKKEYTLGMKFVNKGDIQQAADHFKQAITIYPEYLAARNDLGAQFLKMKQLDEAENHFELVLQQDPKNFNAKFNMGLVRVERKDYLDAITQLNQAIVIDSTRPVARLWLGIAFLESGDMMGAERELMKAVLMGGSECVAAHYHLARVYMSRGDTVEAARSVHAYLQEAPKGEYVKEAQALQQQLTSKKN